MKTNNKNIDRETFLSQWIEGKLSDTELKKLVSKEDFLAYNKLKKGLDVFTELEKPLDKSFTKIQNRIENKPKIKTLNYKWIASIAALFILFFGFYQFSENDNVLNSTNFGKQKKIALLDGSEVILNAKSAIKYSKKNWNTKREIYLNGEAFFKVKKGKAFTVTTKNGDITVLGTQFTVKSTKDFFEVICFEGQVKVFNNGKSTILNSTESYRNVKGKITSKVKYKIKSPTWISGESSYRSVPLKYVISDLEKQFNIVIKASNIDNSLIFTGSFPHDNIDLALKTVFDTAQIKYNKIDKNILVLENN